MRWFTKTTMQPILNKDSGSKWGSIIYFIVFTVMPLLWSSAITIYLLQNEQVVAGLNNWEWLWVSFVLAIVSAMAITPPTFLAVVMGYFIGWMAFPYLVIINLVAITLIYGMYLTFHFSWAQKKFKENKKISRLLDEIRKNELKMIFFTKLSPIFPFAVTNLIFAVSGAAFRNILAGGFAGMIPRTLLAIYVGMGAVELRKAVENPNQGSLSKIVIGLLIIVSALGMFSIIKKAIKQ